MDTNESRIKVLELPNWVKFVNELTKKERLKSPEYLAKKKPNL